MCLIAPLVTTVGCSTLDNNETTRPHDTAEYGLAAKVNELAVHGRDEQNYSNEDDIVTLYGTVTNGPDTNNGKWACAKVATIILREAGVLKRLYLGVRHVEAILQKKKWTKVHVEKDLRPGDVVVWVSKIKGRKDRKCTGGGNCHVGIVTEEGYFHNSPITDRPTIGRFFSLLGVEFKVGFRPPN